MSHWLVLDLSINNNHNTTTTTTTTAAAAAKWSNLTAGIASLPDTCDLALYIHHNQSVH
jgi:hypothetical protein